MDKKNKQNFVSLK